jgi:hypothetical protein
MHSNNNAHAHARALPCDPSCIAVPSTARASAPQPLMTRSDLATLLRVSARTLDCQRAAGDVLDPLPGPGQPRWHHPEVLAWLAAGRPRAEVWRRLHRRRP